MPTGTVKWFSDDKGYGFITADDGTGDLFVHASHAPGGRLADGAKVEYVEHQAAKGKQAQQVTLV